MNDEWNTPDNYLLVDSEYPEDTYAYLSKFFDFLRTKVDRNIREYYGNLLRAMENSKTIWQSQGFDNEGYPVYIVMVVFGSHTSSKDNPFNAVAKVLGAGILTNLRSDSPQKDTAYTQIQKAIDCLMVNFMVVTSCFDEVKQEKLLQIVSYAKRSLVVDLKTDKSQLVRLLTEFIN